ncbi:hypothetical protein BH24PSE2_BH24PSE2_06110 [soil metagenome]
MRYRHAAFAAVAACTAAGLLGTVRAQSPANPQPIALEARSSDFDRRNDRLVFREVTIRQGGLAIEADLAEATRLDFENSLWLFTGDVRIEFDTATIESQTASLQFKGHQLRHAEIAGDPARFAQKASANGPQATGEAHRLEYDFDTGIVTLSQNARLSEGANNITGDWLRYDMLKERIVAGSEGDRVKIEITPPPDDGPEDDSRTER